MNARKNFQVEKTWLFLDDINPAFSSKEINSEIIKILSNRGIKTEKEALEFLNPTYENLADPNLLPDMEKAVQKVVKAIREKKKIAVYGDYDVDGVTATAILVRFFMTVGVDVIYYIPTRLDEGYGLHCSAIQDLKEHDIDLIITVDCGTTAIEEVLFAKSIGVDIIITDHHSLMVKNGAEKIPQTEVINPKRGSSADSSYNLAGVGVAFYLIRAIQAYFPDKLLLGQEKWYLDLVSLGTICDVVPLLRDNRILVAYGLKVLSKSRNKGVRALAEISETDLESIDSYKVGFVLGPRLNAAGRLKSAQQSLKLLLTEDANEAELIAKELNKINLQRQEITEKIVLEAREIIKENNYQKNKIFVLAKKDWPAGVVGIAASRLVEEYSRPVLIMEEDGEELKGSARSIKGFDITKALSNCSECFLHFGGHAQAAGFRLKKEHFLLLEEKLIKITNREIHEVDLVPIVTIDDKLLIKNITQKLAKELSKMEPYGTGNNKPVFVIEKVRIDDLKLVGNTKDHLKVVVDDRGDTINGIAFRYGSVCDLQKGDQVSLAFSVEINEWKNQKKIDLHIIDIKVNKTLDHKRF